MTKTEYITSYATHGYPVFPLEGKIPLKGCAWRSIVAKPDIDARSFDSYNYAVALNQTTLVVDIDPRNFPANRNIAKELKERFFKTGIRSYCVRTGSGGAHIYLSLPAGDFTIRKNMPDFPGIDFLSFGRYVVGPGSIHPTTNEPYTVVSGSLDSLQACPNDLLDAIKQPIIEDTEPDIVIAESDPQTKQRFVMHLASCEPAIEGQAGDETTFKAACFGRDLGLVEQDCLSIMYDTFNPRCQPPWNYDRLAEKVRNAYKYAKGTQGALHPANDFKSVATTTQDAELITYDIDGYRQIKKTLKNAVAMLLSPDTGMRDMVRLNQFTKDIEFTRPAPWHNGSRVRSWTDKDTISLKYTLSKAMQFEVPTALLEETICIVSAMNAYHPVKEYLESLKWDGKDRLDRWLIDYCGVKDTPYTRSIGRKVLVAACKRIYHPGLKFDHMLVIEGAQGIGKSTACRILGGNWYGDFHIDPTNKDTVQAMHGKWICEVSEMECQTRFEANSLKAFISREIDRIRLPYGRHIVELPRQCVFIGTINPELEGANYLKDTTGNRRYWPVLATVINTDALSDDRDQLFAEAMKLMNDGEKTYLDHSEERMAAHEQSLRQPSDPWSCVIEEYLTMDALTGEPKMSLEVSMLELWRRAINGTDKSFDRMSQKRLSNIMCGEFKWEKCRVQYGGMTKAGFRRPVVNDKTLVELIEDEIAKRELGI